MNAITSTTIPNLNIILLKKLVFSSFLGIFEKKKYLLTSSLPNSNFFLQCILFIFDFWSSFTYFELNLFIFSRIIYLVQMFLLSHWKKVRKRLSETKFLSQDSLVIFWSFLKLLKKKYYELIFSAFVENAFLVVHCDPGFDIFFFLGYRQ